MKIGTTIAIALAVAAAPAVAQTFSEADLQKLDKDGDGRVSRAEYQEFANFAFGSMDANRDGSLTPAEMEAHLANDLISELDADSSGTVSTSEFGQHMADNFAGADRDADGFLD
ncbi:hypothetical protein R5H30_19355 [Sulfitobacter sp. D35]|uniref:hypothetical protein n=1 Tax=Sulfitobacter sp. D35 TaxID=3083252 RepID=UPI00296FDE16|nr:hypothetical protein [Sulfitobacter sp. D35]MDW4500153.1 hypothetical protein [Sulfitobacter sp. D35]